MVCKYSAACTSTTCIQLSTIGRPLKFIHLNALSQSFHSDPDLSRIEATDLHQVLQTAYVSSGCDFVSFFSGIGKASFLSALYTHAGFISSNTDDLPGSLANVSPSSEGFLAFIRLIGVIYFVKNCRAFQDYSPENLYHSLAEPNKETSDQHQDWYNTIRGKTWERIQFEHELPPSIDALEYHWACTIWVIDYWSQSCSEKITPLPIYVWMAKR